MMAKDTYQETLRKMIRDGETRLCCVICGEDNPYSIETHHLYGKGNSDETVPLCKNCHAKVTAEQNKLDPKKRNGIPYAAVSVAAFFKVFAEHIINYAHEVVR